MKNLEKEKYSNHIKTKIIMIAFGPMYSFDFWNH